MSNPALVVHQAARRLGQVTALDGVSLSVDEGQIVCLVGHSGCGKSTLLRVIAGVESLDAGSISIAGKTVSDSTTFVEPEHRNVGFMFQDYALFPHLTARQNIGFGLRVMPRNRRDGRVAEVIDRLDIAPLADRYPHQLSGGEQQRIALARAVAPQPGILLMDEPFSNLDRGLRESIRHETLSLIRTLGITAIIVTHDPEEALSTGDVVALMNKGKLIETAPGETLYATPRTAYAAAFFSRVNRLPALLNGDRIETPLGAFPATPDCPPNPVMLVRPQDILLNDQGVLAQVLQRSFLGEMEEISLSIEGMDQPLVMRTSISTAAQPGQQVRISVRADQIMLFAAD